MELGEIMNKINLEQIVHELLIPFFLLRESNETNNRFTFSSKQENMAYGIFMHVKRMLSTIISFS